MQRKHRDKRVSDTNNTERHTPLSVVPACAGNQRTPAKVCAVPLLRHEGFQEVLGLGQVGADWLSGNVIHHGHLQQTYESHDMSNIHMHLNESRLHVCACAWACVKGKR